MGLHGSRIASADRDEQLLLGPSGRDPWAWGVWKGRVMQAAIYAVIHRYTWIHRVTILFRALRWVHRWLRARSHDLP